jgi:uncharacterized protein (DUF2147 family)
MLISASRTIRVFLIALAGLFLFGTTISDARAITKSSKDISGLWYTENHEGGVQLYHCPDQDSDHICGRFYWFNANTAAQSTRDEHNPDPDKRAHTLCKTQFMGGFTPDGEGHYVNGWIYSPRHGATFNGELTMIDRNTLAIRGYVLFPALGENQTWTRAKKMRPCTAKLADRP